MPESHQDRVDRLFNSIRKKSAKQVANQAKKKVKKKVAPKAASKPSLGDTITKVKKRHKMLGDL